MSTKADFKGNKQGDQTKAPYQPPRLRKINLFAEEVMGTGCKATQPNVAQAAGCGVAAQCVLEGVS